MIRMLIVGYCFGIRSERRLCDEVHLNLAYRWFCRLGLEGDVPDHSTLSKNRHGRFRDSELLRELFETTVRRCLVEGLVGGEGFAVDAGLIRADANKQRSADTSQEVDWDDLARTRRSVREYLDTLDEAAWGAASEVKPKFVSRSDPAAQWTSALIRSGKGPVATADRDGRMARSAALLETQMRPSSRKRVKAGQRFSMLSIALTTMLRERGYGPGSSRMRHHD